MSSLEDKIKALQEKAAMLESKKQPDSDQDMEGGDATDSDGDEIEDEDETKGTADKKAVKEAVELPKIDLGPLFDGTDLTEEFKAKATTIFESAVAVRVAQEVEIMENTLAQRALDESVELKEGLVDKVDGYLDFMVEQWIKNNEIALERGIKAEIFESFIGKMKDVFVEHNISLPDDEYDMVESLQAKAEALEETLDEQVAQNIELNRTIKGYAKQKAIEEACEGMTDIDAEKFALLAEEIQFDDESSFAKKLEHIVENYVATKTEAKPAKELLEDVTVNAAEPIVEVNESTKIAPEMQKYLTAFK